MFNTYAIVNAGAKSAGLRRPAFSWALAILAIVFLGGCFEEAPKETAQARQDPAVAVAKPVVREIVEDDEFVGRFEAVDMVEVRSRVDGYLSAIHFVDGSLIKAGTPLFTIDQRNFKTALQEAEAELKSVQAVLAFARDDLAHADALVARGNISRSVVDERRQEFQVEVARGN